MKMMQKKNNKIETLLRNDDEQDFETSLLLKNIVLWSAMNKEQQQSNN